ncbi:DUF2169 family type VI secretion system accessory protein [Falsiroseomonas sp. HW251]|uniref:DUF2169 family type VI secretion system accessory protein n=1 Tax=Falsiroseomonas sp. HW251 TaxID=3390998 RepID=UPI003D31A4D2
MRLVNASGMTAGYTLGRDKDGRERVVVVVKGTFALPARSGATPQLAAAQLPLIDADLFSGEPGRSATLVESDWAPMKPRCDVLLNGSAYAPGGRAVPRVVVGLQVGAMRKAFVVHGPRSWDASGGRIRPGEAAAFERQPISYDIAFGGTDNRASDPAHHAAYADNPVGRGWFHILQLLDGVPMSQTDEANDPVQRPDGRYRPMAFGPIGRGVPARLRHAGTYDQHWQDNVFPFLPDDFDPLYFQSAPEDQRIDFPRGGEQVVMVNLTPDGRREFPLPARDIPIIFIRRRGARVEMRGTPDTILFEPDAGGFTMSWRASLPLIRDIFELEQIVVGHMSPGWWRAMETGKTYYPSVGQAVRQRPREEAEA